MSKINNRLISIVTRSLRKKQPGKMSKIFQKKFKLLSLTIFRKPNKNKGGRNLIINKILEVISLKLNQMKANH